MRSLGRVLLLASMMVVWTAAAQQKGESGGPAAPRMEQNAEAMLSAVVHVKMKALDSARSNSNLGREREGTGIVIDAYGHIVTIGYIVVEAESIEVTTRGDRTVPARLVGYDHPTGLGLLRAENLEGVTPMELGSADALGLREPVMILPHGGRESASLAYVMSKRQFTASWEYLLDSAIFVAPPTMKWAGAALVNREGKLVGIGSLLLRAIDPQQPLPGNMFVPVDTLKPILPELIAKGRRAAPARPWLGLGTEEVQGHLLVTNVSSEGPAEKAGIKRGDIVVGVGSDPVRNHQELYRKMWSVGAAGAQIPLKVLQGVELKDVKVQSIDRSLHFREQASR